MLCMLPRLARKPGRSGNQPRRWVRKTEGRRQPGFFAHRNQRNDTAAEARAGNPCAQGTAAEAGFNQRIHFTG